MSAVAEASATTVPPVANRPAPAYERIALVTGGASGLGAEIALALIKEQYSTLKFDASYGDDVRDPGDMASKISSLIGKPRLDVLVNCAGINRIDWLEKFSHEDWDAVMDVNAKGIFMMSKACLGMLADSKGCIVNIVSNASHMPMTCSAAYNASKGAAHILTQQLARELTKKYGITVFGISPNKLAGTEMSKDIERQVVATRGWTEEYARQYQIGALLSGAETPPERVAEFLGFLLADKERHRYLTGCIIPYGA